MINRFEISCLGPFRADRASSARQREPVLHVGEGAIRSAAQSRGPQRGLVAICLKYALTAAKLRWKRILFRQNANPLACAAYSRMQLGEFQALNARQAWANWRTIPRNLAGRLSLRPLLALDLCCGAGDSTEVLAYYCAPGSLILGLECNATFVEAARARRYFDRTNQAADVRFVVQNVLERFRDGAGDIVPRNSVDLINASGAIGCHFDREAAAILARECARVLKSGGLALIDAAYEGAAIRGLIALFAEHGFRAVQRARSCIFDRYWQICLKKEN